MSKSLVINRKLIDGIEGSKELAPHLAQESRTPSSIKASKPTPTSERLKKSGISSINNPITTKRLLGKVNPPPYAPRAPSSLGKAPRATLPPAETPLNSATKRLRPRKELQVKKVGACNIQVAVRVRALTRLEKLKKEDIVCFSDAAGKTLKLVPENKKTPAAFQFDHVFGPDTSQAAVFDGLVSPMIEEVIKGFSCTIFAYGQTGTGKTFTIEGNLGNDGIVLDADAGVIPRTLHALFQRLEEDQTKFSVRLSMLELYNEEATDLLSLKPVPQKLMLTNNAHNKLQINGIEEELIEDTAAGIALLRRGSAKRHTAFTKSNATSSRSHCIFTITLRIKGIAATVREGKLHIVDLAGSEDTKVSGASNQRAREAGSINQSLLTLGRVISALANNETLHIPYRESKLTRILADSLGGSSKTCIIATVAPSRTYLEETISTLKYASKAMKVTNVPMVNKTIPPSLQVKELEAENALLRQKLSHGEDPHSKINQLLREIQAEKDRQHETTANRLAAECALKEAYALNESKLDSVAKRLLLAAQERTKEAEALRKTIAGHFSDLDLAQTKLNALTDLYCEFVDFFKSNLASPSDNPVNAIDKLSAETHYQKGRSFSVVTELKEMLQWVMSKLDLVSKATPEPTPLTRASLSETIRQRLDQCFAELQRISNRDQPPDLETWDIIKSAITNLGALCEDLKVYSDKIQLDLVKRKEKVKVFKNVKKQCKIALKNADEYKDVDMKNTKSLDAMFLALRNDVGTKALTPATSTRNAIESKLSSVTEAISKHTSELTELISAMKSSAIPQQSTPADLPDAWGLVDADKICADFPTTT